MRTLLAFEVEAVLDVGANRGQYALRLRRHGWQGPIVSFEPLSVVHAELARAAREDPRWHVMPPMALAERDGRGLLERSAEDDMSSLLPQNRLLRAISPSSRVVAREEVALRRLEHVALPDPGWRRLFLKLDVQGAEARVLAGVGRLWPRIVGVQLEMGLVPLYEGECDFAGMLAHMRERGFDLHLLIPGYFEPKLARQLQVDGVFYRRGLTPRPLGQETAA